MISLLSTNVSFLHGLIILPSLRAKECVFLVSFFFFNKLIVFHSIPSAFNFFSYTFYWCYMFVVIL